MLRSLNANQHEAYFTLTYQPRFAKRSHIQAASQHLSCQGKKPSKPQDIKAMEGVKAHAIVKTNSMPMGENHKHGGGVFPMLSRINHDCVPNAQYHYNATLRKITVHAVRDIGQDEEIITAYFKCGCLPRERRAVALLETWGFGCACGTCLRIKAGTLLSSEQRREEMFELMGSLLVYDEDKSMSPKLAAALPRDAAEAAGRAEKLIQLTTEEGLANLDLAKVYHFASKCHLLAGNGNAAVSYAEKELDVERYCIGTDTAHMEAEKDGADWWLKHVKATVDQDSVKFRMNEKRMKKENKRATKKAEKKSGKGR